MRFEIGESEAGGRLDKWLAGAERLGSRARALAALERGKVFLNDAEQSAADGGRRLRAGDRIQLWLDRPGSAKRRFFSERHVAGLHLLYEDDDLLVAVKPAGLLTVPLPARPDEPSLSEQIARHLRRQGKRRPLVVHRIDRDTTGLVVFAKTPRAQERLREQFARREPERVYLAVVCGRPHRTRASGATSSPGTRGGCSSGLPTSATSGRKRRSAATACSSSCAGRRSSKSGW